MKYFLTNCAGSFASIGDGINSRYDGLFFWIDKQMYRTVVCFDLKKPVGSASFNFSRLSRSRGNVSESFSFADRRNAFCYELSAESGFDVVLDCKRNFDNREWGRFYEIVQEKDVVFVRFRKCDDVHEACGAEFEMWLAFYCPGISFSLIDKWELQSYGADESRKSPPYARWVYRAFSLTSKKVVVAAAHDKETAFSLAKSYKNPAAVSPVCGLDTEAKRAYNCAAYSLLALRADSGLFAGLPWFHQRWLRDEIACCRSLMKFDPQLAKRIIFYWLGQMRDDGTFPGTLSSSIADGSWVFVRLLDYLEKNRLTKSEKSLVKDKLGVFLKNLNLVDGVVANGVGETWMDAVCEGDTRDGARIEINALALAACRLASKLKIPYDFESRLRKGIVDSFWNGGYLNDGANDKTVRPNVFIAAYVCPELLPKAKWLKCFDAVLPKLWLRWGGLSTIDKSNKLFCGVHTGEDPKSYHRGDSWFWINNLAALVLYRFDKKRYDRYIRKIVEASSREILGMGALCHHAELSSANELSSLGCIAQAWSAAMFIELVDELR